LGYEIEGEVSLYGKNPLPEFRLWIVGKNGMLIFS
jgi:hypothetical protein